jgi:hypothetical protein
MWLLLFFLPLVHLLHVRIVHTPVVHWFPYLKAHTIVLYESRSRGPIFAVDFTPVKQRSLQTQICLLLGQRVPACVRYRTIPPVDLLNATDQELIDTVVSSPSSISSSSYVYWNSMNLYTRNCQHFSTLFVAMLLQNRTYRKISENEHFPDSGP